MKKKEPFDKYAYYESSVQDPKAECSFLSRIYQKIRKKKPLILREDFSGTFRICAEWVKRSKDRKAIAIDLDPEPLTSGLSRLSAKEKEKILVLNQDVLQSEAQTADVICALNFSYFLFKDRATLKSYILSAKKALHKDGILVLDLFSGQNAFRNGEDKTKHKGFTYFWEQSSFNPSTHEGLFYIHIQRQKEKKRTKVFSYDWRLWTPPELTDLLKECGFDHVLIEADKEDWKENESWVGYIVAYQLS